MMIMKKDNSTDIAKLCTVVLFDSKANHTHKWIGRLAMQHVIEFDEIAPKQYSRPGRSMIDHVLN